MKSQSDSYRNPLSTARPMIMGRVIGARAHKGQGLDVIPEGEWQDLEHGETRHVPAGTVVHVRGCAGRFHSFWFEEDGRILGPLSVVTAVSQDLRARFNQSDRRQWQMLVLFASLGAIGLGAVLLSVWHELGFWSQAAAHEFEATLGIAWLALLATGFASLRGHRRRRQREIKIAPMRTGLK